MAQALFKKKSIKIQTLGEYLVQVRERLNLDIKTASALAQIKPEYIAFLEGENFSKLPSEVYIRGFLKRLAEVYQISSQSLVDQYEKQQGFGAVAQPRLVPVKPKFNFTPKTLIVVTSVLLALLAFGYVFAQIKSVLTAPVLIVSLPAEDTRVLGNSIIVSGEAEIGAEVLINNQAVLLDKHGQFTENLILGPGLNVIEIVAKNKFNRESRVIRQVNAEVVENPPVLEVKPVNITVEIGPESTWIYMEADGVVVQRGTMLAGSSRTVSATEEILLTSANAGSTKVIYNDNDLGKLGRPGEVIRNVEFNPKPVNP
ncbi:MAG: DUF4115 domain-containing protein [Candidatus Doudnabacteria bacterium]|nr:DUF4115 domain-containing protein [Candidatus Doudnabacteria bacterium]